MRITEISRNGKNVRDMKWMVSFAGNPPAKLDMVVRDHGFAGSTAAFFKESMMRAAIIGTKVVFSLLNRCQLPEGCFDPKEKETYAAGKIWTTP